MPASVAKHPRTRVTAVDVRYADGSSFIIQPLVEAAPGMTMKELFTLFTTSGQFQVSAQNAAGARLLWFSGKGQPPYDPSGNAKPPPFSRYVAVVASSDGQWLFEIQSEDAASFTELVKALRSTTT